ncbi:MAG TPA: 3-oxoadipate enol-lactonase [Kineosporiaceae bacterium]
MSASLGYRVDGPRDAPVLVLGSSVGTDLRMWEPQLPALARHFRVVRYDHRGHGASEVPAGPYSIADLAGDVLALLDHLGVPRAHLGGLSLGGMVAMWLAAHAPARVDRVAVFCTSAHLPPAQGWLDRAAAVRAGGTAAVADAVTARWFTAAFAGAHPDVLAAHRAMLVSQPADGYAACCEAIAGMDLRGALPGVRAPTLVVAARDDPATPEPHARVIAERIGAAARVELVDGAHLATVESPQACTELIVKHLATT